MTKYAGFYHCSLDCVEGNIAQFSYFLVPDLSIPLELRARKPGCTEMGYKEYTTN